MTCVHRVKVNTNDARDSLLYCYIISNVCIHCFVFQLLIELILCGIFYPLLLLCFGCWYGAEAHVENLADSKKTHLNNMLF